MLFALIISATAYSARAALVVVPNPALNWEGNSSELVPFMIKPLGYPSTRYQQVYGASQFSAIGSSGAFITRIFFRLDCSEHFANGGATNAQVNLSTTLKAPDNLSPVFAENIGADETRVFGPGWAPASSEFTLACPVLFDDGIVLSTPFFYSPSGGNLLLDVRNFSPGYYGVIDPIESRALDAANIPGDSVSRIYAESVDATNATHMDSVGLVTRFEFQPIPQLTIAQQTNSLVVTWPAEPSVFVLQSSEKLTAASWQTITSGIASNAMSKSFTVPQTSPGGAEFYRLVWESGPPIP